MESMAALSLSDLFPFPLDPFQKEAIAALDAGKSVVVCAPTGSGKTLIGEYAIHRALAENRRVFYTTPLKALSNQKLRDFRERFGSDNVGLLTGDISLERDAPILVMTTEIFRNMLYGTPIGEVGTSLAGLQTVVLDECHYMNDAQRGTVWEEAIVYCPPEVQLVALSATVANSDQLTDWLRQVHGPTELIYSDFRPVPLRFHFCNSRGFFPLLDSTQKRLNPKLQGSRRRSSRDANPRAGEPDIPVVLSHLHQRDMLPAIYFIFSRKGCDRALDIVNEMQVNLVSEAEATQLKAYIDCFVMETPEAVRDRQLAALYRGIAAHHAGILPAWKGLVEELFQKGLIKVVFATETLAAGINMPARTTVISSLSKRTDRGHRALTASEFLQMAGRAGRRGMDAIGHVVTLQTRYEGPLDAERLAIAKADPLASQFTPSYGMVLNLLQTHPMSRAKELVERSFGQYLSDLAFVPTRNRLEALRSEVETLQRELAAVDLAVLAHWEKLRERLREERRLYKILHEQAEEARLTAQAAWVPYALTGSLLAFRTPSEAWQTALLVAKIPGSGQFPWLICLDKTNTWYVLACKDVLALGDVWWAEDVPYPPDLTLRPGCSRPGDATTADLAHTMPPLPLPPLAPEVQAQHTRLEALEQELSRHPVNTWDDRKGIVKKQRRLEDLQTELQREQQQQERPQRYWQEFTQLMAVLQAHNFLVGDRPTLAGQAAAALRGDNELWLALVMDSGELDRLKPHHFAGVCAALVTEENGRPDSWTRFGVSPILEEALEGLRSHRRRLEEVQRRHKVYVPVWLDWNAAALVEQWALDIPWQELWQNTSLDEGDLVRIIRRTLDLLCQLPHVPHLSEDLRDTARAAAIAIDRFPVSEVL